MSESPRPRPGDTRSAEAQRRRRRVRIADAPAPSADDPVAPAGAETAPVHDEPSTWPLGDADTVGIERGLRGIVGSGSSQVTPGAALRARDAARPRPEDLARAEAELTIVRRNWTPRD